MTEGSNAGGDAYGTTCATATVKALWPDALLQMLEAKCNRTLPACPPPPSPSPLSPPPPLAPMTTTLPPATWTATAAPATATVTLPPTTTKAPETTTLPPTTETTTVPPSASPSPPPSAPPSPPPSAPPSPPPSASPSPPPTTTVPPTTTTTEPPTAIPENTTEEPTTTQVPVAPDRAAWVWGDPHMITFDATPYTFHALGMRHWCAWESAGGKKHSMAYYSCGIDCSRDGVKSFFGGWPCGESGGVAAGGEIFGIKVAVVKAQIFVGADVFELKVGQSRAFACPACPGNQKLTVYRLDDDDPEHWVHGEKIKFAFGTGAAVGGDNVTLSTWEVMPFDAIPSKYINNVKLRLSADNAAGATGLCTDGWPEDKPLPKAIPAKSADGALGGHFPALARYALGTFDAKCELDKQPAKQSPTAALTCARKGRDLEEVRRLCEIAHGAAGALMVDSCMQDACALGNATLIEQELHDVEVDHPFVCTATPADVCGGGGGTSCFLDPTCACKAEAAEAAEARARAPTSLPSAARARAEPRGTRGWSRRGRRRR